MNRQERKVYDKQQYQKNKQKRLSQHKKYIEENKEEVQEYQKEYSKIYAKEHKDELKKYKKEYYLNHKEETILRSNNWKLNNKEEMDIKNKKYRLEHKEEISKRDKKYREIPINKLIHSLRNRIYDAIKRDVKSEHTANLIGCSIEFLKSHLENQFTMGMTWQNHGNGCNGKGMKEWHVDHIRPCASFDLSKKSEQYKCFNFKNLQPLWAKENLEKHDKYEIKIGERK